MWPGLDFLPRANISRPDYYYFYHAAEWPAAPNRSSPVVLGKWLSPLCPQGSPFSPGLGPCGGRQIPEPEWGLSPGPSVPTFLRISSWSHGLLDAPRGPPPGVLMQSAAGMPLPSGPDRGPCVC